MRYKLRQRSESSIVERHEELGYGEAGSPLIIWVESREGFDELPSYDNGLRWVK